MDSWNFSTVPEDLSRSRVLHIVAESVRTSKDVESVRTSKDVETTSESPTEYDVPLPLPDKVETKRYKKSLLNRYILTGELPKSAQDVLKSKRCSGKRPKFERDDKFDDISSEDDDEISSKVQKDLEGVDKFYTDEALSDDDQERPASPGVEYDKLYLAAETGVRKPLFDATNQLYRLRNSGMSIEQKQFWSESVENTDRSIQKKYKEDLSIQKVESLTKNIYMADIRRIKRQRYEPTISNIPE
jgi:hypothetical protein